MFRVWLYPYDTATEQEVTLYFTRDKGGEWRAGIILRMLSGMLSVWRGASQYSFLDDLRKQLLLWSSLPPEERAKYFRIVDRILSQKK